MRNRLGFCFFFLRFLKTKKRKDRRKVGIVEKKRKVGIIEKKKKRTRRKKKKKKKFNDLNLYKTQNSNKTTSIYGWIDFNEERIIFHFKLNNWRHKIKWKKINWQGFRQMISMIWEKMFFMHACVWCGAFGTHCRRKGINNFEKGTIFKKWKKKWREKRIL